MTTLGFPGESHCSSSSFVLSLAGCIYHTTNAGRLRASGSDKKATMIPVNCKKPNKYSADKLPHTRVVYRSAGRRQV